MLSTCFKVEVADVVDYKFNRRYGIVDVCVLLHTVDALSVVGTFGKLRFVHCVIQRARYRSTCRKVGKLFVGMHKLQEELGNFKMFAVGIDKTVAVVLRHKRLLGVGLVGCRFWYGHKTELTSSLGLVGIALCNKVKVGCGFVFPPHAVDKHGVYRGTVFVLARHKVCLSLTEAVDVDNAAAVVVGTAKHYVLQEVQRVVFARLFLQQVTVWEARKA